LQRGRKLAGVMAAGQLADIPVDLLWSGQAVSVRGKPRRAGARAQNEIPAQAQMLNLLVEVSSG
jgi:hypothetical protein